MKKRWVVLIALASLSIGVAAASWFWIHFNAQFMSHGTRLKIEADLVTRVAVLEHLRSGRVAEATRLLEILLDGDLIAAMAFARDGATFSPNAGRAVALEAKARAESSYAPADENVRAAVQDALRLIPASTKASAVPSTVSPAPHE